MRKLQIILAIASMGLMACQGTNTGKGNSSSSAAAKKENKPSNVGTAFKVKYEPRAPDFDEAVDIFLDDVANGNYSSENRS